MFHLAGLKSVQQSISSPLEYYDNNFVGTINLLNSMIESDVNKIVFSSSATVWQSEYKKMPIRKLSSTYNPTEKLNFRLKNY